MDLLALFASTSPLLPTFPEHFRVCQDGPAFRNLHPFLRIDQRPKIRTNAFLTGTSGWAREMGPRAQLRVVRVFPRRVEGPKGHFLLTHVVYRKRGCLSLDCERGLLCRVTDTVGRRMTFHFVYDRHNWCIETWGSGQVEPDPSLSQNVPKLSVWT
jgi:hypothetical protein